jgi:hypothetical protein
MITTNMSSKISLATYSMRLDEIEKLAEIGRKIKCVAAEQPALADNAAFEALEREHKAQLQRVMSLSL